VEEAKVPTAAKYPQGGTTIKLLAARPATKHPLEIPMAAKHPPWKKNDSGKVSATKAK
jgi:hypothetical protein